MYLDFFLVKCLFVTGSFSLHVLWGCFEGHKELLTFICIEARKYSKLFSKACTMS